MHHPFIKPLSEVHDPFIKPLSEVHDPFIKPLSEVHDPFIKASNVFFRGEALTDVLSEGGDDGSGFLFVEASFPQPQGRLEGVKQRHPTIVAGAYSHYNHISGQT